MVHMVQPTGAGANGDPAFLVDSNPKTTDLPDTLYLANGTTAAVNVASNPTVAGTISANNLEVQLTCNMTSGWDYVELPDPGVGFTLVKVVSSNGTQILVGPNAWTTHPVDTGTNDPGADLLHILDYNGTGSYTLYYLPVGAQPPAAVSLATVSPNPASGPVASVNLTLSESVDPSTFNPADVQLTLNGSANLINSGVTFTQVSGSTYKIGGLSTLTAAPGLYQLTVLPGVVQDFAGESSTGTVLSDWANGNVGPYVVSIGGISPNPRNTPVDSIDVTFDEAIDPTTFNYQAVSLTLDGGANLVNSSVSVSQVSSTTYQISGLSNLTTAQGTYTLTVNAADVQDASGQAGLVSDTDSGSWVIDTTPPTIVSLQAVTQSPRSIIVPSLDVTFSTAINPSTFGLSDITFSKTGGPNLVNSSTTITQLSPAEFQISGFNNFIYPVDGTYTFTVSAVGVVDLAGNSGAGSVSESWVMDTNPPDAATNLAITPDTGISVTDGITKTGNVTLTGTVDETGLLLDVYDGATELVTDAPIQGESISAPLTLAEGSHDLQVYVVDSAAAVAPAADLNVLVNEVPPAVAIPLVSSILSAALPSATISFSEPVYGLSLANLELTNGNDPNLLLSGSPTLISSDNQTWTLGNLAGLTAAGGNYTLMLSPVGIQDTSGNSLAQGSSVSFAVDAAPTVSIAAPSPTPRNTAVNSLTITFSKAVYGFSPADLSLSDSGGTNLLTSVQALTTTDNVTWTLNNLSGLTANDGKYVLSLSPSGITDATGNPLAAGESTSFTVAPTSSVSPLPTISVSTQVAVQWSGQDISGGSGIATYDVYVQDNGGVFTLWQSNTTATSAIYAGVPGNTYGFYSVATDKTGNPEVKAPAADASTLVQISTATSVGSRGSVYGQSLTLNATVSSTDPAAGTPSGTVQFQINGANVGAPVAIKNGTARFLMPGLNAASYPITAIYSSNTVDFSGSSGARVLTVSPAPVSIALQSNVDWLLAGQNLEMVAIASAMPDGMITFYDNGVPLVSYPLAVVNGQDEAAYDTATLPPGRHVITVGYTSTSRNFAMTSASPVLTEMIFSTDPTVLTVDNTSSDPSVAGSLPWAVAQADASNTATEIEFATGSGEAFATPQTITLAASLDVSDTASIGIEGPSWGVTLVGDYSQSRFPLLSVAQDAAISLQDVNVGTPIPGANGDLAVAGVLDVLETPENLGSALSVASSGTIGLGGQTVTADSLTLTGGSLTDGTLSSGERTVLSGTVSANLTGSGGLVKTGPEEVVLRGTNTFSGGRQVQAGTLAIASAGALPAGSSLTVGANAGSLFASTQGPADASMGGQSSKVGDQAPLPSAPGASPEVASSSVIDGPLPAVGWDQRAVGQAFQPDMSVRLGHHVLMVGLTYGERRPTNKTDDVGGPALASSLVPPNAVRPLGNLSFMGPAQAHDAAIQSLNTPSSAEGDNAAAFWEFESSWSIGPSNQKDERIADAIDAVLARFGE